MQPLFVGAVGLGMGLAVNAATGTSHWPGPLEWIRQHPWQAAGILVALSVGYRAVQLWRNRNGQVYELLPGIVPAAPAWTVERAETAAVVREVMRASKQGGAVGITTAVHGAGGFGKTTLARLVCTDRKVRRRFGDQVYWVTVGWGTRSRTEIAEVIVEVARLVAGDATRFDDPMRAGAHLGSLLGRARRPVLLVLDDVWEQSQLDPFLLGAPNCVRLVTTRVRNLLPSGTASVLVDRLTGPQAKAVLSTDLPGLPDDLIVRLVAACGSWALMLRLANRWIVGMDRTGVDTAKHSRMLLSLLEAGPTAVNRVGETAEIADPARRNAMVQASVQASLDLLPHGTADRFMELGAFAPDDPIPIPLLARLWQAAGLDEVATRQVCEDLERLALLTLDSSHGGAVLLHDVLHGYARAALGDAGRRAVSRRLVLAIEAGLPAIEPLRLSEPQPRVAWWRLDQAGDGYLLDHIVEHLQQAGDTEQAFAVAKDLRWIDVRARQRGPAAPMSDLTRIGTLEAAHRAAALERITHLLAPAEPADAVTDTLHSYLQPLPAWRDQADALAEQKCDRARLINAWPPPDLASTALVRVLTGHTRSVLALAISPDGTWLASGAADKTIRIWDPATGKSTAVLHGHTSYVLGVIIGRDGGILVTNGGHDRTVRVWDAATGKATAVLRGDGKIMAVALSPDGTWIATADENGTVRLWETTTGAATTVLEPEILIMSLAISTDGAWLAGTGDGGGLWIWDRSNPASAVTLDYAGPEHEVSTSSDGMWSATTTRSAFAYTTCVSHHVTGASATVMEDSVGDVSQCAISPDGAWIATASRSWTDFNVRIWDTALIAGKTASTAGSHGEGISAMAVSPDGTWLVTGHGDGTARIRDLTTGRIRTALGQHDRDIFHRAFTALAVSPDGAWIATLGGAGTVRVWNPTTGRATALDERARAVAFGPDGIWIAAADNEGPAQVWNRSTGAGIAILNVHDSSVAAVAVSPDGGRLVVAAYGETTWIWDLAAGKVSATLENRGQATAAVAVSPDSTWIATVGRTDRMIRIWNMSGHCVAAVRTDGELTSVAWGKDLFVGGAHGVYCYRFVPGRSDLPR
ncbi:NB-ARC domain-containing protein [Actinospica durhamensis]|uniref:NB-ARC domain-containing protein n=1 Tax=Actinospica durhamensis TaxID=1508375 RepID=UPI0027DC076F|nr:NB-ARC domain-containing protein [Actinospica durhamensis]